MDLSPEGIIAFATGYIETMPAAIMRGDVFALTITLIAFFIAIVIINRLTGLLIVFLKKVILLIIVVLAFWQFITMWYFRVLTEGLTDDNLIFGAAGSVIGLIAVSIALFVTFRTYREARYEIVETVVEIPAAAPAVFAPATAPARASTPVVPAEPAAVLQPVPPVQATAPGGGGGGTIAAVRETLSVKNLRNDRSLGAVLAYLIIAQFGVFSSMTIPAPSFQVGLTFFTLFIIAVLFFIHFTYNNYLTGLRHLVMAIIVGTIIAIVLGHFWAGIPTGQLLSPAFFESEALVALVTGLALSLFMGGKG
jgi:hypothetical protein